MKVLASFVHNDYWLYSVESGLAPQDPMGRIQPSFPGSFIVSIDSAAVQVAVCLAARPTFLVNITTAQGTANISNFDARGPPISIASGGALETRLTAGIPRSVFLSFSLSVYIHALSILLTPDRCRLP